MSDPENEPAADDAPIPRPRPGRVTPARALVDTAALVAGVFRALVGVVGFGAALLTLPIHFATPVLAGVSILMMVTGCASTLGVTRNVAALRALARGLVGLCALATVVVIVLVAVVGAGAWAPRLRAPGSDAPSVRFESAPTHG